MLCHTCHEPHALPMRASIRKLPGGASICTQCHEVLEEAVIEPR